MPRNQLPSHPFDRLVELERQAEMLEQELYAIRRNRGGRGTLPRPCFTVKTTEWLDGPGYSYPSGTGNPQDLRLPICVQSWDLSGTGRPTYTNRSQYASHYAFSPIGWFPPGCVCQAYWNGRQFVIVDGPPMLHGRADGAITAATSETNYITPGTGNVEIYRYDETDLDPVSYQDASTVTMRVSNAGGAIGDTTYIRCFRDDYGEWWVRLPSDVGLTYRATDSIALTSTHFHVISAGGITAINSGQAGFERATGVGAYSGDYYAMQCTIGGWYNVYANFRCQFTDGTRGTTWGYKVYNSSDVLQGNYYEELLTPDLSDDGSNNQHATVIRAHNFSVDDKIMFFAEHNAVWSGKTGGATWKQLAVTMKKWN